MKSFSRRITLLLLALSAAVPAAAQLTASGTEPASVKWEHFNSKNFHLIYPEGLDSLARLYAAALEKYRLPNSITSGFKANQYYNTPMPGVLHSYTGFANGSVSWAPRNLSLYTNPDSYNPDPQNWIDQLAVHEGRHIVQMQLGASSRKPLFELLYYCSGELFAGGVAGFYPGPTFLEGDAVTAETALTNAGRGRTADFLEYYRVSFADSLWRDYYRWSIGSQRLYTPDHYRAGYMFHAGMRNSFDKADFTKYYFQRILRKPLFPFRNLQKSVKEVSGMRFRKAFRKIEEDFAADWAANDSLRLSLSGPFAEGESLSSATRYFRAYSGLAVLDGEIYAIRTGLDVNPYLVKLDSAGKAHQLLALPSLRSRLSASERTGLLYWTEYKSDLRWEKKSSSRLCAYDPTTGRKRFLSGPDDRWYNPAAAPEDGLVAVVSNRLDGRTDLLVVDGANGEIRQTLHAPDSLQLVEPAWIGEKLYASAIGSNGFGIYAADGWKELLPQEIVKINRLFGRDGRLWFTCDRDGSNELHSLGLDGGLRQETTLRFGGNDWCFAGDSLLYTALSLKDRGVKSLPASALLGMPVSRKPLPRPIPDKLSAQEDSLMAAAVFRWDEMPGEEIPLSEPKPYRKAANLFKVHSWMPFYVDWNVVSSMSFEDVVTESTLGATVFFQNEIESSYGQAGLELLGVDVPALHLQWVYSGWLPVIEFRATIGGRKALAQSYIPDIQPDRLTLTPQVDTFKTPCITGYVRAYVPLNFSSGGWSRGVIPSVSLSASNDWTAVMDYKDGHLLQYLAHPFIATAAVRGYTMLPTPASGMFPRLGAGLELGVIDRPLHRVWTPGSVYGKLYGYLPGIARTHGLRLEGNASMDIGGKWSRDNSYSASLEYALPFAGVDWSFLSPYTYIKNFEFHIYGDWSYTSTTSILSGKTVGNMDAFAGAGIAVHLGNLGWIPYGMSIGVKYMYNPIHPELSDFGAIFNVDM